jgi:hypothetical protein
MGRVKRLFSAWKGGSGGRGAPPPPDPGQPIRIDTAGEKLVEVLTSPDGRCRIGITRDRAGIFLLRVETWAPDWDDLGVATWLQRDNEGAFADSLEHARSLAREHLRALGAED